MSIFRLTHNISYFLRQLGFAGYDVFFLSVLVFVATFALLSAAKFFGIMVVLLLENRFGSKRFVLWRKIFDQLDVVAIITFSFYLAALTICLPARVHYFLTSIFIFVSVLLAINWIRVSIENVIRIYLRLKKNVSESTVKMVVNLVNVIDSILMWLIALLVLFWLMHIDVKGLVSGLGIASIVVAFAFQSTLKDIFAFFTLYVDRSFAVGDYVVFGSSGYQGTIKEIHLRTTRIRALRGNELVVSNYELTNTILENFNRMSYRRVSMTVKIKPGASEKILDQTLKQMRQIFTRPEIADRIELKCVVLDELTEYGVQFKIIYRFAYQTGDSNFYSHLAYKEKVNLAIIRVLEENGLELSQSLLV